MAEFWAQEAVNVSSRTCDAGVLSMLCDCEAASHCCENSGLRCVLAAHVSTGYATNWQSISPASKMHALKARPSRSRRSISAAALGAHASSKAPAMPCAAGPMSVQRQGEKGRRSLPVRGPKSMS